MELESLTFIGLITLGVVNVVTFFIPDIKSEYKFGLSVLVAFGLTFVPDSLGSLIANNMKIALGVAFAMSGTYKLATKMGQK